MITEAGRLFLIYIIGRGRIINCS